MLVYVDRIHRTVAVSGWVIGIRVTVQGSEHGLVVRAVAILILERGLVIRHVHWVLLIWLDRPLPRYNVRMTTGMKVWVVAAPGYTGTDWMHTLHKGKFIVHKMLLVVVVYCLIFVIL